MTVLTGVLAEFRQDLSAQILVAAFVVLLVMRLLALSNRERVRSALVLLGLHLLLVPVAGAFRTSDSSLYRETRLIALIFGTLGFIQLLGTLLFAIVLPRVRVQVPRIVQDVIIAGSSLIAIIVLASRAGMNLSSLIATSAVLTAVIGLAFQDTLGNIVGGLALELDDSVRIGDWIKVGDAAGRVTEIRWRYTAIETRDWETVILPNSLLVKGQVMVQGKRTGQSTKWRRTLDFNVDFRFAPTEVLRVVREMLANLDLPYAAKEPAPRAMLMNLSDSFGRYIVRYWLTDPGEDTSTESEIRTRIYFALRRAGIPLSIPAQAVFVTQESSERKLEKSSAEHDRRLEALRRVELFSGLSDAERQSLVDHLHYTPFATNEVMTHQGAVAHWLYMIITGEATIHISKDGGPMHEVAHLHDGDFFGEMGLLTGQPRIATVIARTPVECYRLDKSAFQGLIQHRPEMADHMADILARRRTELTAANEGMDEEAERERMRKERGDVLDKIKSFFGLD
jgi:small-conductance mechanosensitive channel/CRP-like cAMP-binding protein